MFVNNISADKGSMMQVAQQRNLNNNKTGNEGGATGANNGLEAYIIDISQQGKDMISTEMRDKLRALDKGEKVQSSNSLVQTLADGISGVQESLEELRGLAELSASDDPKITDDDRETIQLTMNKAETEIPKKLNKLAEDLMNKMSPENSAEFARYLAKQQDPSINVVSSTEKFSKNLQDHLQEVYVADASSKQDAKAAVDTIDRAISKSIKIKEDLGYDKYGNFIKGNDEILYGDVDKARAIITDAIRSIFDRHHTVVD